MGKTFWHQFILLFVLLAHIENTEAVPARRELSTITQPNGTTLSVWIKGDEFFHYAKSTDGYILLPDKNGYYMYAVQDSTGALCAGEKIAVNEEKRSDTIVPMPICGHTIWLMLLPTINVQILRKLITNISFTQGQIIQLIIKA
jgi:hypothetical protein